MFETDTLPKQAYSCQDIGPIVAIKQQQQQQQLFYGK